MWASILFLVALAASSASSKRHAIDDLLDSSKTARLLAQALDTMQNDSSTCGNHINFYVENLLTSDWAMKMFDSSTKIPESLLMYQFIHLGNFDECLSVEGVVGPENDTFDAQHCMVTFSFPLELLGNNPMSISKAVARQLQLPDNDVVFQEHRPQGRAMATMVLGVGIKMSYCLPSSCSPEMIRFYFNETANSIFSSITVPAVSCSQGSKGRSLQTEDWIALTILVIFGCLCVMSTGYDLLTENKKRKELFTSFSWYSNGKKLLATSDTGSDTLHALHGIRFISMSWVVLGHSHMQAVLVPVVNIAVAADILQDFWRLYLTNATLSVDTFYFLSGLLVSYIFLKQMNKPKSSFNIALYYFHRYIRLTPPYAILILFHATLLRYMGAGPLWDTNIPPSTEVCRTKWWTEILYVNNYVEVQKMCIGQSWYLAVDMHLFILSPIVLIPLWKWSRKLSLSFLGVLILCGLSAAFSVSYIKKLPSNMFTADVMDFMLLQYFPTHTRVTPWLIGILFGYILYETKRKKITISKTHALLGWLIGATALLASLLSIYPMFETGAQPTNLENTLYTTFSRSVWALGVGWVTFACVSGIGGPVNTFLSWKLFQPLSRLSYCVYLVHGTWQMIRTYSTKTPGYLADINFIPVFFSDLIISLLLAAILSLCFESPIIILEKHLLGSGGKKSSKPAKGEEQNLAYEQTLKDAQEIPTTSTEDNHQEMNENSRISEQKGIIESL